MYIINVIMPIKEVRLTADAFAVCLTHALTTEKEEIMGLLIGEVLTFRIHIYEAHFCIRIV